MNSLLQEFADALTEGIRRRAHPDTISESERKALERMNALCDGVDAMVKAKPVQYVDEFVRTCFKKTKSHPQPVYMLRYGELWPTTDEELLAAFTRQGFTVTKSGRVFATPTLAERKRRGRHLKNSRRHERLYAAVLQLCEACLGANDGK